MPKPKNVVLMEVLPHKGNVNLPNYWVLPIFCPFFPTAQIVNQKRAQVWLPIYRLIICHFVKMLFVNKY